MATNGKSSVNGDVQVVVEDPAEEEPNCCDKIFATSCCVAMEKIGGTVVNAMEKFFYKLVSLSSLL